MVKYLALAMALVGSLVVVDLAQAGHRHHRRGCSSCGGCQGGDCYVAPVGCANGACAVPVYGAPVEGVPYEGAPPAPGGSAPPAPEATSAPVAPAAVTVAPAAQPTQYISTGYRRGLFGRRR